jgi:dTDP-4-amino-4,6-dideoxygalactose transaminase
VHLFGQSADMESLLVIANQKQLPVLEDCAQAAGASCRGRKVGSLGALGAFSFYPTKVLGGFGDGGMVVTKDESLHARLRRLRFYGMEKEYYSEEEGFNSRLDEVQAAILDLKLQRLDRDVQKRRANARRYDEGLAGVGDVVPPAVASGRLHQFYAYTIKTDRRDGLQRYLREQGIETKINYPFPVHLMRGYASLGYRPGSLPVTERLAGQILSLPLYPGLSVSDVDQVVDRITRFFSGSIRT